MAFRVSLVMFSATELCLESCLFRFFTVFEIELFIVPAVCDSVFKISLTKILSLMHNLSESNSFDCLKHTSSFEVHVDLALLNLCHKTFSAYHHCL